MQKIILFYKFTPIKDPDAVRLWQKALAEKHNLRGRLIIADHGINGTLGGDYKDLKSYINETKTHSAFKELAIKWGEGGRDNFPRLSVKVRPEIVTFGVADQIKVDHKGVVGSGKKIKPEELHELVEKYGEDVVFFDGRNAYEAAIGKFKNAVVPKVDHTRDFKDEIKRPQYDELKDKPVVTYCTGGIRCEVLSMLMKQNGFKEVYQVDGGIAKYGEAYADDGYWEGALYVFDGRMTTKFSDKAKDIGHCSVCEQNTSNYENCINKACNKLILICENCLPKQKACSAECESLVAAIKLN